MFNRIIATFIIVLAFTDIVFGIHREKLYKDDVGILHPKRVKGLKSIPPGKTRLELNIARSNKKERIKPKRQKGPEISLESIQKLKTSVDSTLQRVSMNGAESSDIPVPSIISFEFRFESGSTYHATTDVIITDGGILKHEPGAVVKWAQDTELYKDPNGVYIARGLPGEMCINIPDVNEPSPGYWKGIKLVGGDVHTSLSEVMYSYVAYAHDAFVLSDIALSKFENNFVEYSDRGIVAYGPKQTRISNNVAYGNWSGIDAFQEDESGTTSDPNYVIEIISNTCHENDYGISISGTSLELAQTVIMERNISTASVEYNYSLWSGNLGAYFYPIFIDNGRWLKYGGSANTNYDPASWEYNPVEVFFNPYDPGSGYFDIVRLKQTGAFVDASLTPVWESHQVGFTTSKNDIPDVNTLDLGFHYANWEFSNTDDPNLLCDFSGDSYVSIADLAIMVEYWLEPYNNPAEDPNSPRLDLDVDGVITLNDFSYLSNEWQKHKGIEAAPLIANFSDGEYGEKVISLSGYDDSIVRLFLFVDGYFAKELFLEHYNSTTNRQIFVPWLKSGQHEAKIIAFDLQNNLICYPVQSFSVADGISECVVPILFEMGKSLPFSASSTLSSDVKVSAWSDQSMVWDCNFPAGSNIIGGVPPVITNDHEIEYLRFTPVQPLSGPMMAASGSGGVVTPTSPADADYDGYTALMVRPKFWINFTSGLAGGIYDKLEAMGYKVKKLGFFTSTYARIKKYQEKGHIEVLYYTGHGGYEYAGKLRTKQELDDGTIISDKASNYTSPPSWLTPYSAAIESSVKTWKEIGFDRLKFASFDCCLALRLKIDGSDKLVEQTGVQNGDRNDLSKALNLGEDCFLFGWSETWISGYTSEFEKFSSIMWTRLQANDTLYEAIQYAISKVGLEGDKDPRKEYRIYGVGDMFNFRL